MNKSLLVILILCLVVFTTLIKNSSKNLEDRIANEIIDLAEKKSKVFTWRKNLIADVIKNRHNASYKW